MSVFMSLDDASGRLLPAAAEGTAAVTDSARARDFSQLWQQSQASVRAYLASFLPDGSVLDDCVQEVAVVAWQKGPLTDGDAAFLHHALACARLIGMAARRKILGNRLKVLSPDVAQALADSVAIQERPAEPSERVEALRSCLGKLSPEQQALVGLRYGDSSAAALSEEARRAGKSLETLYKRLERLRQTLRDCVTRHLTPPSP